MPQALIHAAELSPELRLAQAVSEFQRELSQEQKREFLKGTPRNPSPDDVMRLTAEIDRLMLRQGDRQCFGPRMTSFLQGIQQFASIGDVVVGGSQFLPACGVWTLVRVSLLSIVRQKSYVDSMSRMFMEIGRSAPSYQRMALLFPQSKHLQDNVVEYLIRVVQLCHRMLKHSKKSGLAQFFASMIDASGVDRKDLEMWSLAIRDEMEISSQQAHQEEAEKNSKFRLFQRQDNELTRQLHKEASRLRILDALSTYDYQSTWKQLRKIGNTTVLTANKKYSTWKNKKTDKTLYLTGQLGAGKSVVLANMVDDLFLSFLEGSALVAYFFCRYDIKESLAARTIIGAIARQILKDADLPAIPSQLIPDQLYEADIAKIVHEALKPATVIYVVLDGFYDCEVQVQEDVFSFLKDLQRGLNVFICISARMRRVNVADSPIEPFSMVMPRNNPDIPVFIEQELERLLVAKILVIRDPQLILEIRDQIALQSQDMFLWVALQLLLLCSETTDDGIRQMLKEMPLPSDLAATYTRLMSRPSNIKNVVRINFLNLVLAAFRPLTIEELHESLSVTPGDIDWDPAKVINDIEPIISAHSGLIVHDEEQETIRLVHPSAVQFLQQTSDHMPRNAHEAMAFTILTYLSYPIFETSLSSTVIPAVDATLVPAGIVSSMLLPGGRVQQMAIKLLRSRVTKQQNIGKVLAEQRPSDAPRFRFHFQHYARRNWLKHLYKAEELNPDATRIMNRLIGSRKLLFDKESLIKDMSTLGIDHTQDSALICWAISQNHISIAKLLLKDINIDPNSRHNDGIHPLMDAVKKNQPEIVSLILQNWTLPRNWSHYNEGDPLEVALQHKSYDIASILIQSGRFNPNNRTHAKAKMTHLTRAVYMHQLDTVRFLIECPQVDNDKQDGVGRTALQHAIMYSRSDTLNLLLDDVDVNIVNSRSESALTLAASSSFWSSEKSGISKLILNKQLDPNVRDARGSTALHIACSKGYEALVKMLVSNARLDPNIKDSDGRTALHIACRKDYTALVEILITDSRVEPSIRDHKLRTALHIACSKGHEALVKKLISDPRVDPNIRDQAGKTALHIACSKGHEALVKKLISDPRVDPNIKDSDGRTALLIACRKDYTALAEILNTDSRVDLSIKSSNGETALHFACRMGWEALVKRLVSDPRVDPNIKDPYGRTALHTACQLGHVALVAILSSNSRVNLNIQDPTGRTPLSLAASCRSQSSELVQNLVERGGDLLDVNLADQYGWTPLDIAKHYGNTDAVNILLKVDGIQLTARNKEGKTPADSALSSGASKVHTLLEAAEAKQRMDQEMISFRKMLQGPIPLARGSDEPQEL